MANKKKKPQQDFLVLVLKACVVFSVVILGAFCGFIFAINGSNDRAEDDALAVSSPLKPNGDTNEQDKNGRAPKNDTINKNIFINDVAVGGLKTNEAEALLETEFRAAFNDKSIEFIADGKSYNTNFSQFKVEYDIKAAVQKAYDYTRGSDEAVNKQNIDKLQKNEYKIIADVTYDETALSSFLNEIANKLNIPPIEPTMKRVNGEFVFTKEESGKSIDVKTATADAGELIKNNESGTVNIAMTETPPKITTADLRKATDLLGTYSTSFSAGNNARNTNINNAASKLNGVVLLPGQVFSTNEAFGEMSAANGYKKAPTILGNKLVDDYGGGVCQVSSTLYNAILYSELEIVERTNHSLKVGYLDWAYDATLAGTYIDLKFKNDTEYPVTIEAYTTSTKVIINLYGHEKHPENRRLVFENALVQTNPPGPEVVTEDPTLPLDQRVEDVKAKTGYVFNLYKLVYEGDKLIEKVLINKSTYKPVRGEVRIGTGPAAPPEATDPNIGASAPVDENIESIPLPDVVTQQPETPAPTPNDNAPLSPNTDAPSESAAVQPDPTPIIDDEPFMP